MKITENPDGTITLDPRPGVTEWREMGEALRVKDNVITQLRTELKASREAHHETTNQLRKLKQEQEAAKPVDILRTVMEELFGPSPRKK